ncbi:unnamed protein product [Lampetra fluviatilis]
MSGEKMDSLATTIEAIAADVAQIKAQFAKQSEELDGVVQDMRRDNNNLEQKYAQMANELREAKHLIQQLQDTKVAFEAKERQAQKLNRQL